MRNLPVDVDLEEAVFRSRRGDPDSFDALVAHHYGVIFGLAYRMLGSREAAEDATQEVFIKAWDRLPQFRGASRFSTWLYAIAVHHCLNAARKRTRESAHCQTVSLEETREFDEVPARVPDVRHDRWDLDLLIWEAIQKLPEKLRIVVVLHYFAAYSPDDMAHALQLPANTVRSRLRLAKERLRRDLEGLGG